MNPFGNIHDPLGGGAMDSVLSLQTLGPADEAALSVDTTACSTNGCTTNSCSSSANTSGCTTNGCVCNTIANLELPG
jgi:hypothetical protein